MANASKITVGIVIITYNNVNHVSDAITSVKGQTFHNWVCWIVDNGSSDETASVVEDAINNDSRFQFVKKENEGPSAGRNHGYALLPEDLQYIHFLDGDDRLKPFFLEKMVDYLEAHPAVGLLGCQFDVIDENGNILGPGFRSRIAPNSFGLPRSLTDFEPNTPFETFFSATGQGPFALFRNSVFKLTTGYEQDFWSHEDSDIFCQMCLEAEVHYMPDRLYEKRTHGNNLTFSPKADYKKFRDKWDYFVSDRTEVNIKIECAIKYYYGIHAPIRHFKVGLKAAGEFIKQREKHRFEWMLKLFKDGLRELLLSKTLKNRLAHRR